MAKLVGFNLSKISIEKENEIKGKIEIKSNIHVENIKKETIEISKENDILAFEFSLTIDYEPKIAKIQFKGDTLVLVSPEESKEIMKKWKKKEIADPIRILVFNTILAKCNIRALQLEEELNLPTHIPMPKLAQEQQKSYMG